MLMISTPSKVSAYCAAGPASDGAAVTASSAGHPAGDIFCFTRTGGGTEIVIGFRPACDRLVFASSDQICLRQDGASTVIVRKCGSLVVLDGVDTRALTPADIAFDCVQ